MWAIKTLILLLICGYNYAEDTDEETSLYYYGLEESESSLPACAARQACGARLARYWRGGALLRLCRCARRRRCDAAAPLDPTEPRIEINNRAVFQFCEPIDDWPQCAFGETALVAQTAYDNMDPDELEKLHHKNVQLTPPKVTFNCRCPEPNYWKLKHDDDGNLIRQYQCGFLTSCKTDEYCGNVDNSIFALYQSCLCPKRHICVRNAGITRNDISELLYRGKGWKAYCQKLSDENDDDD